MKEIRVLPKFVNTRNVRNFTAMIEALELSAGEGRLGMVFSVAGRGKTRTCQWYAVNNRCVFLRCLKIWRTGELDFLQALCRELGIKTPPHRKGPAFMAALEALKPIASRPVFIEEIEKLPALFLELVRDLSDLSTAPIVLVGEEELVSHMKLNRRVWSRTFQQLEFQPLEMSDVIMFAREAAGLAMPPESAALLHKNSDGDFRLVKRDLISLANIMNAKGTTEPTPDLVKAAIKQSLRG